MADGNDMLLPVPTPTQPPLLSQLSVVQKLLSSQPLTAPGLQPPPLHWSSMVQALLSLHGSELLILIQPLNASHKSVVHGLPSSQSLAWPPPHLPPLQVSPSVHGLPSSQLPLLTVKTQPFFASQLSEVQTLPSSQSLNAPGWHTPPAQLSPSVHTLLSLQSPFNCS